MIMIMIHFVRVQAQQLIPSPVAHLRTRRRQLCRLLQRHLLGNQLAQHRLLPLLCCHLPPVHLDRQPRIQVRLHVRCRAAHRR